MCVTLKWTATSATLQQNTKMMCFRPLRKYAEEHIKKLPKNSLLSFFFRTFVVDLELGSEHRKQGPFPMHELKLNNPLREQAAPRQIWKLALICTRLALSLKWDLRDKSLNSEKRPFSCQEMKLRNPRVRESKRQSSQHRNRPFRCQELRLWDSKQRGAPLGCRQGQTMHCWSAILTR